MSKIDLVSILVRQLCEVDDHESDLAEDACTILRAILIHHFLKTRCISFDGTENQAYC